MEIKAVNEYQIPKFALALAAAALAGTMTACQTGGEVATSVVAPAPVETDVRIMGDAPISEPDPYPGTITETDPTLILEGDVDEPSVTVCDPQLEDFSDASEEANLHGVRYAEIFAEAFAQQGVTLIPAVNSEETRMVWSSDDGQALKICFFYPNVRINGRSMHDAIASCAAREYRWGIVTEQVCLSEETQPVCSRTVYVNIDWCTEEMSPENAARIAEEVLKET